MYSSTMLSRGLLAALCLAGCALDPVPVDTGLPTADAKTVDTPPLDTDTGTDTGPDTGDDTTVGAYTLYTADLTATVGYMYDASSTAMDTACSGRTIIPSSADGTREACVDSAYVSTVTGGRWEDLAMRLNVIGFPTAPTDADLTGIGCRNAPSGLAARFNFDAIEDDVYTSGSTTYDGETDVVSGSTLLLYSTAAEIADGEVMRGLACDGSSSGFGVTIDQEDAMDVGTGDFSIALWVRMDTSDATTGARSLVDKRDSSTRNGYQLYLYNRRPGLQLSDSGGYTNYTTSSAITVPNDGAWHHLVVAVSRTSGTPSVKFYVDRLPKQYFTTGVRTGDLDSGNGVRIGRGWWSGSSTFAGDVDEVQIYTSALSYTSDIPYLYWAGVYGVCR